MSSKNPNRPMASIARRINLDHWLDLLAQFILTDVFLITAVIVIFAVRHVLQLGDGVEIENILIRAKDTYAPLSFIVIDTQGAYHVFNYGEVYEYGRFAFYILFALQIIKLITSLGSTSRIRRRLKPLNDLAVQAEELSRMSYDPTKMMSLAEAIEKVSPDAEDIEIRTGDRDLRSIEIALNNLIRGMKESEKRQMRFVDDASHELRTPIAVILGYANMLDRWGKEDEAVLEESIEAIKNESQQMKELVDQLLFLARGDNGRNHLQKTSIDLGILMDEVCEESMMIDAEHNYYYKKENISPMIGDITMIKQSMRIFIQNASKYSPAGATIKLTVGENEDSVWYSITDEGTGISGDDINHIFDRFYRSDDARNSKTGGSGLGLSIAKWIVDSHDGTIEVISMPEVGSRFTVKFHRLINVVN